MQKREAPAGPKPLPMKIHISSQHMPAEMIGSVIVVIYMTTARPVIKVEIVVVMQLL